MKNGIIYVCLFVLSSCNLCIAQQKIYEFEELGQPIRVPLAMEFVTRDEISGPIAWGAFTDAERNALVGVHMEDGRLIEVELAKYGKRSEEHTSELQSREKLVCRLLL